VQVRLLTLGGVRCFRGDREIAGLPGQRLRCAVLVHLAVEREVTRESLVSLLWPERDPERARHALNQQLYELRQALGEEWLESQADPIRVTSSLQVDVHAFEAAAGRGALEEALSAYGGEFLAGFFLRESAAFEHWIDRRRGRLARLHRQVRGEFIDQCVARGDSARAIAEARRWVELEPTEDEAQHRLIERLAAAGDRAEAIRQYDSYQRVLEADELEPLEHTQALIEAVRQGRGAPPGAAPAGPGEAGPGQAGPRQAGPRQAGPGEAAGGTAPEEGVEGALVQGHGPAGPPASPGTGLSLSSRRRRAAAIAIPAALLAVAGSWWWGRYLRGSSLPERSIAVLPFLNFSADPEADEHLSDGIAEELIHALSQIEGLDVAARTSSFRFRDQAVDIRMIGDSLDVALVLEGSVRREGSRLRVTAQLIKVTDGYHLLSRTFDADEGGVLALQEEIANDIADALRVRLGPPERARITTGGTDDPDAYQHFLRGRYLLQKGTRPNVRAAIAYLDSAVARDPGYALAHAELAQAYVLAAARGDLPRGSALASAQAVAERGISLAPRLSEAHAALGRAELELWNWSAAERAAKLAIELSPDNASAHATYAGVLMVMGRLEDAVREGALAVRIEPLSAAAAATYAEALRGAGRLDESVRAHRKALELEPDLGRQNLAKAFLELGMYDSARVEFGAAADAGAPRFARVPFLWSAYVAARAGDLEIARTTLRGFEDRQPQGPTAYLLASAYMALGDTERVFRLLQDAIDETRQPAWRQLPWDPVWDPIRDDPRFRLLLERMGL